MTKKLSPAAIAVLLIALFTFGASLVVNRTVFERLPHLEDEFAYLYQAKIFAGGHAWVPRTEPVKVFWQPFVIQPETSPDGTLRRFTKYTPGWPLVLAVGAALGTPWIVNAFLSMFTVLLVYRLGREVFDEMVGLVGALLVAISPMALLLNATLMSHTAALFFTMLFIYAYWRTTKLQHKLNRLLIWGALSGLALGWLVGIRPLTAVAMAIPVGLHALSRILDALGKRQTDPRQSLLRVIGPLVLLAAFTLPMAGVLFGFNYAVTGTIRSELYSLQWPYDKVGFGPDHGLNKFAGCESQYGCHTLEFGFNNLRADMNFWFRDLFGWTMNPEVEKFLDKNLGYGAGIGISFIVVLLGLYWGRKHEWIWLLAELFLALVLAQLLYWIGSAVQGYAVYSVRYYYEGTGPIALVAAYGIVAQCRAWAPRPAPEAPPATGIRGLGKRLWPGYVLVGVLVAFSLVGYTPARFRESLRDWPNGLYGFNKVGQYQIDAVNALREAGKKVLVIILRDPDPAVEDNWRDYGALMAVTSPYLDSDIVVARLFDTDALDEFKQRFSDRQVLYQVGDKLYRTPEEASQTSLVQPGHGS